MYCGVRKMEKIVHNVESDEVSLEALSETEIAEILKAQKENEKFLIEQQQKAEKAAIAKAALLDKLGITEEEAKLLLS
jgi:hypothetical protein